ncbi:hypothetical protein V502_06181 [Pseudogymnoascus sp. VKM F-4520 (FW-2644)]|nr:hypothetical protein V502_06181 [Pseudogymnoascus sp. VKM F-4520 (FW-2644)]
MPVSAKIKSAKIKSAGIKKHKKDVERMLSTKYDMILDGIAEERRESFLALVAKLDAETPEDDILLEEEDVLGDEDVAEEADNVGQRPSSSISS